MMHVETWWYLVIPGETWWYLVIPTDTWWYLVIHGNTWWYLVIPGYTWWYMMITDDTWWYLPWQPNSVSLTGFLYCFKYDCLCILCASLYLASAIHNEVCYTKYGALSRWVIFYKMIYANYNLPFHVHAYYKSVHTGQCYWNWGV
jgi:hypothetical protein